MEPICPEIDRFQVDRGARDLSPKSGCPEIRISGPRRQSVARAYNFEDFGAGWLFGGDVGRKQDPEPAGAGGPAGVSGRYRRRSGYPGSTGVFPDSGDICRGQRQAEAEVPAATCRQIGRFWVGRRNCILPDIWEIRKSGLRGGGGYAAFRSCGFRRRRRPRSWVYQLNTGAANRGRWLSRRGRGFMGLSAHGLVGVGSTGGSAISPETVRGIRKSDFGIPAANRL